MRASVVFGFIEQACNIVQDVFDEGEVEDFGPVDTLWGGEGFFVMGISPEIESIRAASEISMAMLLEVSGKCVSSVHVSEAMSSAMRVIRSGSPCRD